MNLESLLMTYEDRNRIDNYLADLNNRILELEDKLEELEEKLEDLDRL